MSIFDNSLSPVGPFNYIGRLESMDIREADGRPAVFREADGRPAVFLVIQPDHGDSLEYRNNWEGSDQPNDTLFDTRRDQAQALIGQKVSVNVYKPERYSTGFWWNDIRSAGR